VEEAEGQERMLIGPSRIHNREEGKRFRWQETMVLNISSALSGRK
jgi:hypothetical protein